MKRILLILFAACPLIGFSQVEKGRSFIGGNLSVTNSKYSGSDSQTATVINPQFGTMISSRTAIGGGFTYNGVSSNTYTFALDFFHRWYVPVAPSFYFILHSQIAGGTGESGQPFVPADTKLFEIFTGPRFAWFASPHWSLEANIGKVGYSWQKVDPNAAQYSSSENSTFTFNMGSVGLGVYYYFGSKP